MVLGSRMGKTGNILARKRLQNFMGNVSFGFVRSLNSITSRAHLFVASNLNDMKVRRVGVPMFRPLHIELHVFVFSSLANTGVYGTTPLNVY